MDRQLARTNPRLYATRWLEAEERDNATLVRALAPEDLALHVEALLTALTQPPALAGAGRLVVDVHIEGLDALRVDAYHEENVLKNRERKRYRILDASDLRIPEARTVLDAVWAANMKLGGRPARVQTNGYSYVGLQGGEEDPIHHADEVAFELLISERVLGVVEALFSGLPLLRGKLQAWEATYGWSIQQPDGSFVRDYSRPGDGYASFSLIWRAPDGEEVESYVANGQTNSLREAIITWAERVLRERDCPLWQRWQAPGAPSMLETPP
jgi:hypothetical protein